MVEKAGVHDPFAFEVVRPQNQTIVTFPKNCSLPRIIDQNERLLTGTSWSCDYLGLDTSLVKCRSMEDRSAVIAYLSNVSRTQTPLLTRDHCAGDLSARQDVCRAKLNLGTTRRVAWQRYQSVHGIQSDTDYVNPRSVHHFLSRPL